MWSGFCLPRLGQPDTGPFMGQCVGSTAGSMGPPNMEVDWPGPSCLTTPPPLSLFQ